MAPVRSRRSAASIAASRLMDADFERVRSGEESLYTRFAAFVGTNLATDKFIREQHDNGFAVVIVDEHDNVEFLPAPVPRTEPAPWPY